MNEAKRYRVCNLVIQSNILLPELAETSRPPDFHFELLPNAEPCPGDHHWFNRWIFREEVRLSFAFLDADYLLRFPDHADFLVSRAGPEIKCRPLPDVSQSTVRHLLLDSVIPLILSRREPLVLHASAILAGSGAIAFIGASGQGKSTLAASHGQLGYPLISDDYLVLRNLAGSWFAIPSYPGVRLMPKSTDGIFDSPPPTFEVASYTTKRRISDLEVLPFTEAPSKMTSLYMLDDDGVSPPPQPSIEPVSRRESFMKLVSSSFNLDITDKELLSRQFATLRQLVAGLPCFRLRYAREFGILPAVSRAIAIHQKGITEDDHRAHGSPQDGG